MTTPRMRVVSVGPGVAEVARPVWQRSAVAQPDSGVIVHVCGAAEDAPRLAGVISALRNTGAFEQVVLAAEAAATKVALTELGVQAALREVRETVEAMRDALTRLRPVAVVTHADDPAGMAAALAAARLGVSIVRVGAAPACPEGRAIARLADLLMVRGEEDADVRFEPERTHVVGNPLIDAVRRVARAAGRRRPDFEFGRYVLAVFTPRAPFAQLAGPLAGLAPNTPLVLAAPPGVAVPGARSVHSPSFVERLSLERAAGAIITDSERVQEEAAVLGVRCYALAAPGLRVRADAGGTTVALDDARSLVAIRPELNAPTPCAIPLWDGRAGARVADVLLANFARVRLG